MKRPSIVNFLQKLISRPKLWFLAEYSFKNQNFKNRIMKFPPKAWQTGATAARWGGEYPEDQSGEEKKQKRATGGGSFYELGWLQVQPPVGVARGSARPSLRRVCPRTGLPHNQQFAPQSVTLFLSQLHSQYKQVLGSCIFIFIILKLLNYINI